MIGVDEQEKVRALLREAVTVLCRTGLPHCNELTVEGLLGITLNSQEVFLVNINERIKHGDDSMGVDTNLVPGVSPVHSRGKSARHRKRQRDREKDTRSPTSGGARKTAGEPNNKKTKAVDGPAPDEAGGESEDEHHSEDETETRIKREDDLDKNETEQTQNSPITTTASAGDTTKNKSEPSKDAAQESGSDGASEQGNNNLLLQHLVPGSPDTACADPASFSQRFDDLAVAIVTNKPNYKQPSNKHRKPPPTVRDMLRQRSITSPKNTSSSSFTRSRTVDLDSATVRDVNPEMRTMLSTPSSLASEHSQNNADMQDAVLVERLLQILNQSTGPEKYEEAAPSTAVTECQESATPVSPPQRPNRSVFVSDLLAMRRLQKPKKMSFPDLYSRSKTVSELLKEKKKTQLGVSGRATTTESWNISSPIVIDTYGKNIPEGSPEIKSSSSNVHKDGKICTPPDANLLLPRDREKILADHISQLSLLGYRYYIIQVLQLATQMAEYYELKSHDGTLLNDRWYSAFLSRWPQASVCTKTLEILPREALKYINWDLVDLAATQDALEQEELDVKPNQLENSVSKKSASDILTEMVMSGLEQETRSKYPHSTH